MIDQLSYPILESRPQLLFKILDVHKITIKMIIVKTY